jgi:cytochrome c5
MKSRPIAPLPRLVLGGAAMLVASCAPLDKAAPRVETLALPPTADVKMLEAGRQIYATSCTHCHGPARIDRHGDEHRWRQDILPKMCEKSKLSADQTALLELYVVTARRAFDTSTAH